MDVNAPEFFPALLSADAVEYVPLAQSRGLRLSSAAPEFVPSGDAMGGYMLGGDDSAATALAAGGLEELGALTEAAVAAGLMHCSNVGDALASAEAEAAVALQFAAEEWAQWCGMGADCSVSRGTVDEAWCLQADERWGMAAGWGAEAPAAADVPGGVTDVATAAAAWLSCMGAAGSGFAAGGRRAMRAEAVPSSGTACSAAPRRADRDRGFLPAAGASGGASVSGQKVPLDHLFPNLDWSALQEQHLGSTPLTATPLTSAANTAIAANSSQGSAHAGDDEDLPGLDTSLAESVAAMALGDLDLDLAAYADAGTRRKPTTSATSPGGSPPASFSTAPTAADEVPSAPLTPALAPSEDAPWPQDPLWRPPPRSSPNCEGRSRQPPVGTRPVDTTVRARLPPPSEPPPPPPSGLLSWPSLPQCAHGFAVRSS
mmetsp:Transcript_169728/g.544699  ORF Transcript_169728/g.544699 Transcript_169728/m.544699 type:complete len:430 (+) Transcript_169728:128-1417(+)